jgi:F0F1-type ATP synthase assembly protein I
MRIDPKEKKVWIFASRIAYDIVGPIVFGVIIGYYLDGRLGTRPKLTLSLLFFGVFVGFYSLYKTIESIKK